MRDVVVTERKPFLLRLDPATMTALRAWAADDLRSLNGQIEFLLRRALREVGRLPGAARANAVSPGEDRSGPGSDPAPAGSVQARRTRRSPDRPVALEVE